VPLEAFGEGRRGNATTVTGRAGARSRKSTVRTRLRENFTGTCSYIDLRRDYQDSLVKIHGIPSITIKQKSIRYFAIAGIILLGKVKIVSI
jgi:hypothetical protein